jgi:hypothetical protein
VRVIALNDTILGQGQNRNAVASGSSQADLLFLKTRRYRVSVLTAIALLCEFVQVQNVLKSSPDNFEPECIGVYDPSGIAPDFASSHI